MDIDMDLGQGHTRPVQMIALTVGGSVLAAGALAAAAGFDTAAERECTPSRLVESYAVNVAGVRQPSKRDDLAVVSVFEHEGGLRDQYVTPPKNWHPLRATDAELSAYHFPPRPQDAAGRLEFTQRFSNYRPSGEPSICTMERSGRMNR